MVDLEQKKHHILVVDDYRVNRIKLSGLLKQMGYEVSLAENGDQALDMARKRSVDVILLDIIMPVMDGYDCLFHLKQDTELRAIPVIIISDIEEMDSVVRCIESGAEDYLPKPFNAMLLKARLNACLQRKLWHDQEHIYMERLQAEQKKSDHLLLNILPQSIARRMKNGETIIADSFMEVTVLFADIVGFSRLTESMTPAALVETLNRVFSLIDRLMENHGLEKIKTIGDAYMAVAGVPLPMKNSACAALDAALSIHRECARLSCDQGHDLALRIGLHTGPAMAGIIGEKKFSYDVWGDTVNIASRMESHGVTGGIHVSSKTFHQGKHEFEFESRGLIHIKGKDPMETYLLTGKKDV